MEHAYFRSPSQGKLICHAQMLMISMEWVGVRLITTFNLVDGGIAQHPVPIQACFPQVLCYILSIVYINSFRKYMNLFDSFMTFLTRSTTSDRNITHRNN